MMANENIPVGAEGHKSKCPICSSADGSISRVRHLANQFRDLHGKMHKADTAQHSVDACIVYNALMVYLMDIDPEFPKFAAAQLAVLSGAAKVEADQPKGPTA